MAANALSKARNEPVRMRSGNVFVVEGELIDALDFTVQYKDDEASMGETLGVADAGKGKSKGKNAEEGTQVKIKIRFRSPLLNNNGDIPVVDHIDLIAGDITGMVAPENANYNNPTNPSARVVATFEAGDWETDEDGWNVIVFHTRLTKSTYFRLRGTNNALESEEIDQTSPNGDPALDMPGQNTPAKAWADLWFYSNPIFVTVK
jgi:hypothetical protein